MTALPASCPTTQADIHYALCLRARENDQQAWSELWELSQGAIRQFRRMFFLPRINDRDELDSSLQRGFYEAVRAWNPSGGLQFLRFVRLCMHRKVKDLLTRMNRQCRAERNIVLSLDQPPPGKKTANYHHLIGKSDPQLCGSEHVDLPEKVSQILRSLNLSAVELECLMDLVTFPLSAASEREHRLQRSYKSWDNAMSRVRKKSRAWGKHHPNEYQNLWSAF